MNALIDFEMDSSVRPRVIRFSDNSMDKLSMFSSLSVYLAFDWYRELNEALFGMRLRMDDEQRKELCDEFSINQFLDSLSFAKKTVVEYAKKSLIDTYRMGGEPEFHLILKVVSELVYRLQNFEPKKSWLGSNEDEVQVPFIAERNFVSTSAQNPYLGRWVTTYQPTQETIKRVLVSEHTTNFILMCLLAVVGEKGLSNNACAGIIIEDFRAKSENVMSGRSGLRDYGTNNSRYIDVMDKWMIHGFVTDFRKNSDSAYDWINVLNAYFGVTRDFDRV